MITVCSKSDVFRAQLEDTEDGIAIKFLRKRQNRDTGIISYIDYDRDILDAPFHVACRAIQEIVDQLEYDNPEAYTTARRQREIVINPKSAD